MKFFLDTADINEIKTGISWGSLTASRRIRRSTPRWAAPMKNFSKRSAG
jgi:hypothetical protein